MTHDSSARSGSDSSDNTGSDSPWNDPKQQPFIEIKSLTKKFGDFAAVNSVSLDIYRGELFTILGGSGCGKSTLLRMLA